MPTLSQANSDMWTPNNCTCGESFSCHIGDVGFPLPVPIYKLEGASIALCAVEFFPVFPKLSFKLILDKRNTN